MTNLTSALLILLAVMAFFVFATLSAPASPALATVEYMHDPAAALLDRQAEREHAERMAEIELQAYNDRMFWRAAWMLIVLAIVVAVLGVLLSVRAVRVRQERMPYVLPAERRRLMG